MLQSFFQPLERELILGFREAWTSLKGSGKQKDQFGNLINAKDELIDGIVQDLFEAFPERDLVRNPGGALAFSQSDRDKLHTV